MGMMASNVVELIPYFEKILVNFLFYVYKQCNLRMVQLLVVLFSNT
jgi:hypothetical protein